MTAYVIIPGIGGSDEGHWQSHWQRRWGARAVRIAPASWTAPDLSDWVSAVQAAHDSVSAAAAGGPAAPVTLVAHSLGCWAAAAWLDRERPAGVAAFLVAPPDPREPAFPRQAAASFQDVAARPLPCPGLVVAADDDPYCGPLRAASFAAAWGAPLRLLGGHGHINAASGLGDWPAGQDLLRSLSAGEMAPGRQ